MVCVTQLAPTGEIATKPAGSVGQMSIDNIVVVVVTVTAVLVGQVDALNMLAMKIRGFEEKVLTRHCL